MTARFSLSAAVLAAALVTAATGPAAAGALSTGMVGLSAARAAEVTPVGYWYGGRYYHGCWNCRPANGAAVGAGVALGILGAAAIAGAAASAPPPPPVVYYEPLPPPPVVYVQPRPERCWVQTGPYNGQGYWSPC